MATIGSFTKTENGFTGAVETLTLNVKTHVSARPYHSPGSVARLALMRGYRVLLRTRRKGAAGHVMSSRPIAWGCRKSTPQYSASPFVHLVRHCDLRRT